MNLYASTIPSTIQAQQTRADAWRRKVLINEQTTSPWYCNWVSIFGSYII